MRYNISSISSKITAANAKTNAALAVVASDATDCITTFFGASTVASGIREESMWRLAEMIVVSEMEVKDWTFVNSAKAFLTGYVSAEGKAWSKLTSLQQGNFSKLWSEVVTMTKKTGTTARVRRAAKAKKGAEKKENKPMTYEAVAKAADVLTVEEQMRLMNRIAKKFSNVSVKVA